MSHRNVMAMFREDFDACDPWGSTMAYLFPLAEILRRFDEHPADYRPSPAELASDVPAEYGEDTITTELWDGITNKPGTFVDGFFINLEAVRYAYAVLTRYESVLSAAGRSY